MPTKKTLTTENAAADPTLAAKPKASRKTPVVEVASKPRVKTVKHSKASVTPVVAEAVALVAETAPVVVEAMPVADAHEAIARIAYGYWVARGFQPGSPEQDWLRAEREYLLG